jgi:FMNH2-dependent dimethyl sulfone monooxygenase
VKLALYLPNFRTEVTIKELEDLTELAEELDFDSVWTLDRIVVPEASDREELQHSFGMMEGLPKALPVASRGQWFQGFPLIPWLAAKTSKVRIGMSIIDTPFRAPGVLAAELATIDHLSNGRLNVGLGAGWMPEEFAAARPRTSSRSGTSTCGRRSRSCRASGRTNTSSTTASSPTSISAGSARSPSSSHARRSS